MLTKDLEGLNEWEGSLSFRSMRSLLSSEELEKRGVDDSVFATLLNSNAQIRIADKVFELDDLNKNVNVTPVVYFETKNNLLKSGDFATVYSVEEDVLAATFDDKERLSHDIMVSETNRSVSFCGRNKNGYHEWNFDGQTIKCKIVYQAGSGIFPVRSLIAKIKAENIIRGGRYELHMSTKGNGWHENYWDDKSPVRMFDMSRNFSYSRGGTNRVYSFRPYYSTRRLTSYDFTVIFEAYDHWTNTSAVRELSIGCNRRVDPIKAWL